MRKAGLLIIVLMLFLSNLNLFSFSTSAGPLTEVWMEPEYQEIAIDVAPGSSGINSTQINVTCQTATPVPVMVSLATNCPGAATSISPAGMVFQTVGTETKEADIDFVVPIGTSSSEYITCDISGIWSQGSSNGDVDPVRIQVIVLPYSLPQIWCESPKQEVTKGDSVSFILRVNNSGNTDDTYQIKIVNKEELKDKGITVNDIADIAIIEDGFDEIEVKVRASSDTKVKGANIDIVVTSTLDEEPEEFRYQLNIEIKEKSFSLDVLSSPIIMIIIAAVIIVGIVVFIRKKRGLSLISDSKRN